MNPNAGTAIPLGGGAIGQALQGGGLMQTFGSGATRSSDEGKNDYEGFLSFPVIEEFGEYMTRHQVQADGALRESDNWQKGMPITSYMKSLLRHVLELWGLHRGKVSSRLRREYPNRSIHFLTRETACACLFNLQGFLHEFLKQPLINQKASSDLQAAIDEIRKRDVNAEEFKRHYPNC